MGSIYVLMPDALEEEVKAEGLKNNRKKSPEVVVLIQEALKARREKEALLES